MILGFVYGTGLFSEFLAMIISKYGLKIQELALIPTLTGGELPARLSYLKKSS